GTPGLNALSVGNRRYYKQLAFSTDRNTLYTMSNPNSNNVVLGVSTAYSSSRNIDATQTSGAATTCDAAPANSTQPLWPLTATTPAAVGVPVVAGSNPLSVQAPLTFQ